MLCLTIKSGVNGPINNITIKLSYDRVNKDFNVIQVIFPTLHRK